MVHGKRRKIKASLSVQSSLYTCFLGFRCVMVTPEFITCNDVFQKYGIFLIMDQVLETGPFGASDDQGNRTTVHCSDLDASMYSFTFDQFPLPQIVFTVQHHMQCTPPTALYILVRWNCYSCSHSDKIAHAHFSFGQPDRCLKLQPSAVMKA
ncbi:hypothetical protein NPIL_436181 [Nephila pilipes]|uniref:Uncharacterized protein n=1 Tax=Nephila pilipes TaxID=299642 RepID=A0A8X6TI20_NEPPI|nr:hypothetical protein NPIL_436181 [Nephila pilipes]